jgi:hypothetical protein
MRRGIHIGVAMIAAAFAIACGSDDAGKAQRAAMGQSEHDGENVPPVVRSVRIQPAEPAAGQRVRAIVSVRDPEGDPVTLDYAWAIDGEVVSDDAEIELSDVRKGATVSVIVTAHDPEAAADPMTAEVRVIDQAPVISGLAITPPETVAPGERIVVTSEGRDPDGDSVTFDYEWTVNGERRDEVGNTLATDGLRQGDEIVVKVWANDGNNQSQPLKSSPIVVGSAHPEIVSNPPGFNDQGAFVYDIRAIDPDGDRSLRYRLDEGPEGMKVDEVLGELVWRPRFDQEGIHAVAIVVRDSTGLETTQSFEVTVRGAAPPASAP